MVADPDARHDDRLGAHEAIAADKGVEVTVVDKVVSQHRRFERNQRPVADMHPAGIGKYVAHNTSISLRPVTLQPKKSIWLGATRRRHN